MPLRNRKEFNGQDDWLKKQLKKEKKTSVWDFDSDVLQKVAGGGVYETVTTIIKEVPNVVKNI